MSIHLRIAFVALSLFAAVSLTACSAPGQGLTHAEFVAKLDQLCSRSNQQLKDDPNYSAYGRAVEADDFVAAGNALASLAPLKSSMAAEFEELKPPTKDAANYRTYVESIKTLNGLGERTAAALKQKNLDGAAELQDLVKQSNDKRISSAVALGTSKCGQLSD